MAETNGSTRVPLRELFETRFDAIEDLFDQKMSALTGEFHRYCEERKTQTDDHEARIRSLEKRDTLGWISQAAGVAMASLLGIFVKRP